MRTFILLFYINLMIGCYHKNLGSKGSVLQDGKEGYWKLVDYKVKAKSRGLATVPDMALLHTRQFVMQSDSIKEPIYSKGMPYILFGFFDKTLTKASFIKAVEYDHSYDAKSERSRFWYRINQESGFLTILDVASENRNTNRLEISNVITSATYKPELDSVRFIYKPTAKFR